MKSHLLSNNTLQLLKAFIASHAVFNALTFVQNQIADDEKRAALKALSTFANFIRKTADEIDSPTRAVVKEWEMLKVYCILEQWRFSDRLNIEFKSINENHTSIPSFLYAPFIEQIILIGLLSKEDKITIILNSDGLGLHIETNFNITSKTTALFNKEQSLRKQLLEQRITLFNPDFDIQTKFQDQIASLTIDPK